MFQIYGPNDDTNKLIPYVIKNCLKNKNFNLTNGYQTRDFCHINDIVRAVIMLLKSDNKKIYGNIFNISSGKSVTVKNLVNKIKKKVGLGKPNFGSKKIKKNEIIFSHASIKKIKKFIGWSPKISLNNGVKNLISYEK